MLEQLLKPIIAEEKKKGTPKMVILNLLREYIQYLALNFIYNHKKFKKLVFKGGSCLRICFNLPRLSEDLDFDFDQKKLGPYFLKELTGYLKREIKDKYYSALEIKKQANKRIYLKFPFLYNLNLAQKPESNKLYVKIETDNKIPPFATTDITPVSKFGFNFIAYHLDLPSLMAGKIHALLYRLWFKGKKQEVDIKGRDFYDLFWFFKNKVEPNWKMLNSACKIKNKQMLKKFLKERIKKTVTPKKLKYDLLNFIPDQEFVEIFSQNYQKIIEKYLS